MELRFAIRVADTRDHKHLSSTIRLANQRSGQILLLETSLPEADAVILRRGEAGSTPLLRACETATRPVPVIYSMSDNERSEWVLRWPARTTDLISLGEAIYRHLQFPRDELSRAAGAHTPAMPSTNPKLQQR